MPPRPGRRFRAGGISRRAASPCSAVGVVQGCTDPLWPSVLVMRPFAVGGDNVSGLLLLRASSPDQVIPVDRDRLQCPDSEVLRIPFSRQQPSSSVAC